MEFVAGIDLGTSYFKVALFDWNGRMCGLGRSFVPKELGDSARCELAIDTFWRLLRQTLARACESANAKPRDIRAVSYSSQANSFVLLDKHFVPLTPLILWPDSRANMINADVLRIWESEKFLQTTGLGLIADPGFCLSKLKWFQENKPEIYRQVGHIMTISDYLCWGLTGQVIGDGGTASLLGIYDVLHNQWWDDALCILGIDPVTLSNPYRPGTCSWQIDLCGNKLLGLAIGTKFAVGSLDHHMAAIGVGVPKNAMVSESTGTVLACVKCSDIFNPKRHYCSGPDIKDGHFFQLSVSDNGAGVLQWYKDNYAPDLSFSDLIEMAKQISTCQNEITAFPCANKYPDLSGFQNAGPKTSHGQYVRAILNSNIKSLAQLVDNLCDFQKPPSIIATGGGAQSDFWLQQKANLLGIELIRTDCEEPACRGAAMLAAIALGLDEVTQLWVKINKRFVPI